MEEGSKSNIVFCETEAFICPVVSFSQFVMYGSKLITLIGEIHDANKCVDMPPNSISISEYVTQTLHRNPKAIVFLEIGPDVCKKRMRECQSRPIRELSCVLDLDSPQVNRMDVRNLLLGRENKDFLYVSNLTYDNGPMPPLEVERYFLWRYGSLKSVAADLVRRKDPSVLQGPIAKEGVQILEKQDADVKQTFLLAQKAVSTYKKEVAQGRPPTQKWWIDNLVNLLKIAWGAVLDYFILYNIFSRTSANELVIVVGENHVRNIIPRLQYSKITKIPSSPPVNTGQNGCIKLTQHDTTGSRIWSVVAIQDKVCEDLRNMVTNTKHTYISKPVPKKIKRSLD